MMPAPTRLIVFVSDNHTRNVAGCYGHRYVKTPTIDRFAAEGVRFTGAYTASPLCCPARAAMATGRFPHQTGYWDNALAYDGRVTSWMRRLRDQGYTVSSIGKLHYRSSEDDNGFTQEILPMHMQDGRGAVKGLLRGYDAEQPKESGVVWQLYADRATVGETHYQEYDRQITAEAVTWLREHARDDGKPWVLVVSYISPHPPFTVPKRLMDLYPEKDMPLPPGFRPGEASTHPAARHLRALDRLPEKMEEAALRRIAAGYFGLITHLDEQIGAVMREADALDLTSGIRIAYTSDHGELFGANGLLGKRSLYEGSAAIPLIFSGPGIARGIVSRQLASQVDLYPTIVDLAGGRLEAEDADLPGTSLWPALQGRDDLSRPVFAETHTQGSKVGACLLRQGDVKLIHHAGLPPELFDLAADPDELQDLAALPSAQPLLAERMRLLDAICDITETDARAKADQRAKAESYGGREAVGGEPYIIFTPPPGVSTQEAWAGMATTGTGETAR
jgi:choline-sulfatase